MSVIIFIIVLAILILAHELGHFLTAKKFGIKVEEFGFGYPPKIYGIKRGETTYSINWLPFGGFVKIFGQDPDEESTHGHDSKRSFVHKPKSVQAIVLSAGIIANILLAWLLFSVGFISGLPVSIAGPSLQNEAKDKALIVSSVLKDSPAYISGLEQGDKIISLSQKENVLTDVNTEGVQEFISSSNGKEINISLIRNGEEKTISVLPKEGIAKGKYAIGISMDMIGKVKLSVPRAFYEGAKLTGFVIKETVVALYDLIKGAFIGKADFSSVTGPIGIIGVVGNAYSFGFIYLISFMAFISINLAIINLIPFPALDGGRLFFLLIEKIKGSPINPKIANTLNSIGFILLVILMVVVTYHDVIKLF
ncbi:MAG: RIP metalloprotease RseP [Candidatus Paceibacterota bacterium]|jgi:regulator of sigma E protease